MCPLSRGVAQPLLVHSNISARYAINPSPPWVLCASIKWFTLASCLINVITVTSDSAHLARCVCISAGTPARSHSSARCVYILYSPHKQIYSNLLNLCAGLLTWFYPPWDAHFTSLTSHWYEALQVLRLWQELCCGQWIAGTSSFTSGHMWQGEVHCTCARSTRACDTGWGCLRIAARAQWILAQRGSLEHIVRNESGQQRRNFSCELYKLNVFFIPFFFLVMRLMQFCKTQLGSKKHLHLNEKINIVF